MTKDEALKLALEAITTYLSESPDASEEAVEGLCDAASALRKALAEQPAQLSKPWVGLTQEDMYEIGEFKNTHGYVPTGFKRLVAAIEAKLREKNA